MKFSTSSALLLRRWFEVERFLLICVSIHFYRFKFFFGIFSLFVYRLSAGSANNNGNRMEFPQPLGCLLEQIKFLNFGTLKNRWTVSPLHGLFGYSNWKDADAAKFRKSSISDIVRFLSSLFTHFFFFTQFNIATVQKTRVYCRETGRMLICVGSRTRLFHFFCILITQTVKYFLNLYTMPPSLEPR